MFTFILFFLGLFAHGVFAFNYMVNFLEKEKERTFGNFLIFIGFMVGFVSICIVFKSYLDLFVIF